MGIDTELLLAYGVLIPTGQCTAQLISVIWDWLATESKAEWGIKELNEETKEDRDIENAERKTKAREDVRSRKRKKSSEGSWQIALDGYEAFGGVCHVVLYHPN